MDFLNLPKQSFFWRLGLAVLFLVSAGVTIGFLAHRQQGTLREISFVVDSISTLRPHVMAAVGGDIVVSPPSGVMAPVVPDLVGEMIAADTFGADSMVVKDVESGAMLFRKNEYERQPIASITKLMSALVLLERPIDWATTTVVVADKLSESHVLPGEIYTLDALWKIALIGSSNRAILTLADASGWSRVAFVARMNEKARELGMTDAVFVEPTGLDAGNMASAADVALLLRAALAERKIQETIVMREFTALPAGKGPNHLWSTNWLILRWIPHTMHTIHGGKTGYITASGYNFTVSVGDAAGHTIDVVVLGAKTHEARFSEARDIADWVLSHYHWPETASTTIQ